MARTKAENFDDVRETILKAAARLFAEKGFRNTNIIDIGQACGASKSRMYHYFPSKDAMLEEMLMQHVDGLIHLARRVADGPAAANESLREYIFLHLKYYYEGRDRHTVLIEDVGCLNETSQKKIREAEQTLMNFLASLLRKINPDLHLVQAHRQAQSGCARQRSRRPLPQRLAPGLTPTPQHP
jgi:AcrR family transcriptional regulator